VEGLPSTFSPPTSPEPGEQVAAKLALKVKVVEKPQMLEINPGIWDGLSPEQAKKYYPEDWERFLKDPYAFRAPRAESYHDLSGTYQPCHLSSFSDFLLVRLEPILIELEKEKEDLLIIGHASVIRCMLSYLIGLPASEIPAIEIARGDLLEIVPASYGVHSRAFHFWDGPGRRVVSKSGNEAEEASGEKSGDNINFYENYAEDTKGKRQVSDTQATAAG
jgi:6-phosphofructo-2-kinase/fructose-2,6-biphosphatase 4